MRMKRAREIGLSVKCLLAPKDLCWVSMAMFVCLFVLKKDMVAYSCTPSAGGTETGRSHVLTGKATSQKTK